MEWCQAWQRRQAMPKWRWWQTQRRMWCGCLTSGARRASVTFLVASATWPVLGAAAMRDANPLIGIAATLIGNSITLYLGSAMTFNRNTGVGWGEVINGSYLGAKNGAYRGLIGQKNLGDFLVFSYMFKVFNGIFWVYIFPKWLINDS